MKDAEKSVLKALDGQHRQARSHPKKPKTMHSTFQSQSKSIHPDVRKHDHHAYSGHSHDSGDSDHHHGPRKGHSKSRFQRATSSTEVQKPQQQLRVRSTSGSAGYGPCTAPMDIPVSSPKHCDFSTPRKSPNTDMYFAMAKFNESPEPSALPAPPMHWRSPCKAELRLNRDGMDLTADLKMLLRC